MTAHSGRRRGGEIKIIRLGSRQGGIAAVIDDAGKAYIALDRELDWVEKFGAWAVPLAAWEHLTNRGDVDTLVVYERDTGKGWEVNLKVALGSMRRVLRANSESEDKFLLEASYFKEVPQENARPI